MQPLPFSPQHSRLPKVRFHKIVCYYHKHWTCENLFVLWCKTIKLMSHRSNETNMFVILSEVKDHCFDKWGQRPFCARNSRASGKVGLVWIIFVFRSSSNPSSSISSTSSVVFTRSLSWVMRVCTRLSSSRAFCRLISREVTSFLLCTRSLWMDFNVLVFTDSSSSRQDTRLFISDKDTAVWSKHTDIVVNKLREK